MPTYPGYVPLQQHCSTSSSAARNAQHALLNGDNEHGTHTISPPFPTMSARHLCWPCVFRQRQVPPHHWPQEAHRARPSGSWQRQPPAPTNTRRMTAGWGGTRSAGAAVEAMAHRLLWQQRHLHESLSSSRKSNVGCTDGKGASSRCPGVIRTPPAVPQ